MSSLEERAFLKGETHKQGPGLGLSRDRETFTPRGCRGWPRTRVWPAGALEGPGRGSRQRGLGLPGLAPHRRSHLTSAGCWDFVRKEGAARLGPGLGSLLLGGGAGHQ